MRIIFSIFIFLVIKTPVLTQDYMTWSFNYSFSIDRSNYFDSLEVLKSEPFDLPSYISSNGTLTLNDSAKIYTLTIDYGCISCGYPSKYIPPNVYLKVFTHDVLDDPYFIIIPITSEDLTKLRLMGSTVNVDLGVLNLHEFNPLIHTIKREGLFQGLKIKRDGSIEKYIDGKYNFPSMQKMTTIKAHDKP